MPEPIKKIEAELAEAQIRWREVSAFDENYEAAYQEVLRLERELAKAKGEPYAAPSDFPIKWSVGAPIPYLLCNGFNAFLIFNTESKEEIRCLVTFKNCCAAKLGHPSEDELFGGGHPLCGHGLEPYRAQIVENSSWINELNEMNRVDHTWNPEQWTTLKHYVFWFHDNTFECIAVSYDYEVTQESMRMLLSRVQEKLVGGPIR